VIGYYKDVVNYYKGIHNLKRYGGYTIMEINSMMPYEMEIYALQVLKDIQDEQKD
jgi:hypothetical protein